MPEAFAGADHLVEVVEQPDREDDRSAEHDAERLGRRREHQVEGVETPGHEHRQQEGAEHGDPTEGCRGDVVHPPLIRRHDGAELQRQHAHDRGQQETLRDDATAPTTK